MALEQEGYRWRNDDGSETGATWLENQDTPATFALDTGKRIRILVNASGDPSNAKYRLEYKKSTDSQWKGVPVAGTAGHAITLATSSNIAAGGANTTAQLTAPSGKNTSDFDTGRVWDDENGLDEIDVTSDDYTELEWCIQAVTGVAAATDVYQFRVTREAAAAGGGGPVTFVAIAESTPEAFGDGVNSTTITASGPNSYAIAAVFYVTPFSNSASCTYDGNAMTELADFDPGIDDTCVAIYGLANPPTTSNAAVVSTLDNNEPFYHHVKALIFNGVHQTTPTSTPVTASGTSDPATVDVTSVGADDMVVDFANIWTAGSITIGANQTQRGTILEIGGARFSTISTETGTGTITMSWACPSADGWVTIAFALKPVT